MNRNQTVDTYPVRKRLIISFFVLAASLLVWRAWHLQISNKDFLRSHGDARSLRVVKIPVHRGVITDRNNEPLAISTPVDSIWANPRQVLEKPESIPVLASHLAMDPPALEQMLRERISREFIYLKRHISPDQAQIISSLGIYGVYLQREFKRYYPAGEVAAHLVGFTSIDDTGQEGIELAYDQWLKGVPGEKRVLKDRLGRIIQDVESIQPSRPGKPLVLSIDRRVQYLAYRELLASVNLNRAISGTLVLLDATNGEVIAMASQPSYNPNNRSGLQKEYLRNRALTDVFEPGSTLKPFGIAAALSSGLYKPATMIETNPGFLKIGHHTIHDIVNHGVLDLSGIIQKSSNVGISKIALSLGAEPLWNMYRSIGFGEQTGSGFPGESPGILYSYSNWSELDLASASFGHGLAVTAMQLARAYSVIATNGILRPVTFQKTEQSVMGKRVMPAWVAKQVRSMLEQAVEAGGTGQRATIPLYHVAGKTGTAHKAVSGGYSPDRYISLFAGMAPATDPRLVLVVMIDEPKGGEYYGGQVAAPVFSKVMQDALRILDIAPDRLPVIEGQVLLADKESGARERGR